MKSPAGMEQGVQNRTAGNTGQRKEGITGETGFKKKKRKACPKKSPEGLVKTTQLVLQYSTSKTVLSFQSAPLNVLEIAGRTCHCACMSVSSPPGMLRDHRR